jgi:hypothetical protein
VVGVRGCQPELAEDVPDVLLDGPLGTTRIPAIAALERPSAIRASPSRSLAVSVPSLPVRRLSQRPPTCAYSESLFGRAVAGRSAWHRSRIWHMYWPCRVGVPRELGAREATESVSSVTARAAQRAPPLFMVLCADK